MTREEESGMDSQEPPIEQPEEEPALEQPRGDIPSPKQPHGDIPVPERKPGEESGISPDPREQPGSEVAEQQMPPQGYVPQQDYPPQQQELPRQQGYPSQGFPPQQDYPQQQGYVHQQQGFPPQQGFPQQQGYVPQQDYPPPQGYPPQQGYYAGPGVAPRRRRGPWLGCLIALIIVVLLCAGGSVVGTLLGFGLGIGGSFQNSATLPAQTFTVGANPVLILTSNAGSVTINSGSANNRMIVQAKKFASFGGNLNNIQINYSQSGSTLTVATSNSRTFNFFNATSVDFVITVPNTTDLQVHTNADSITVNGVSGKMLLTSNAGTVGATQASLNGSSTFQTNAGSVNFDGSIASTGTYDFETNAGSVNLTLLGNCSFHLNAKTNVGSINTNFAVSVNRNAAGATASGDVGTAPQAILTLKTNAGSINLKKG